MTITGEQVREARKLLVWSQQSLANRLRLSVTPIRDFESGKRTSQVLNLSELQRVLASAGIEFTEGEPSVKLRKGK